MKYFKLISWSVLVCQLAACGGPPDGYIDNQSGAAKQQAIHSDQSSEIAVSGAAIPQDSLLPWERLDADGFGDPATARMSSAINENSEFWRGVDAFSTEGTTAPAGQALNVTSGSVGGFGRSSATYRIPLAGENPATLATDINLRLRDNDSASEFYIGIANYSTGRWDFFGPFSDGRIRLPLSDAATGDYISPLGNAFISIVAFNGSRFDIVGVSLNQFDPGDFNAPPVPGGLTLSPVAGGLELQWNSVLAGDLAGYRIYWSSKSFVNPGAAGVKSVSYLEGSTRHVLSGLSAGVFVAVSAVDLNGNESAVSSIESASPLAGDGPVVELTTDASSGRTESVIQLTASGAISYDWDLDGDGIFETTADTGGVQLADTSLPGIIRPAVRGSSGGGTAVALGAVSLIIAANLPPVARLSASEQHGVRWPGDAVFAPLLDASGSTDEDVGTLQFAFDQFGDGNFSGNAASSSFPASYPAAGSYLARVRVTDSGSLQAYAYTLVIVLEAGGWDSNYITFEDPPNLEYIGYLDSAMVDGHPAMVYTHSAQGLFYVRANDAQGRSWPEPILLDASLGTGKGSSLKVVNGRPAIAFARSNQVCYIRAANATGDSISDWSNPVVVTVDDGPAVFAKTCSLETVAGRPAIAFSDEGGNFDVFYVRASNADGNLALDWTNPFVQIEPANASSYQRIRLIVAAGNPAVCFSSGADLMFERATNTTGDTALDWAGVAFNLADQGSSVDDSGLSLSLIDGNPALAWYDRSATPYRLRYRRSNTPTGATSGDWAPSVVLDTGSGTDICGEYCSLAEVAGKPAVSYRRSWLHGSTLFFVRALDSHGSAWGFRQLADGGLGDFPGYESQLVTEGGWAGIAHYDGLIAGNVIYFSSVNLY